MNLFVILTNYNGTKQAEAVFSTRDKALYYLKERKQEEGGMPEILEDRLCGEMTSDNVIFVAACYVSKYDSFDYKGLYGNQKEAEKAAGNRGLFLPKKID
ncbi:MAG: hypothetical protein HQM10_27240 [Candidatus Riflebacteria bacterium]|nr:hypothetical protein [Candidatus Riflebacteria bacterium]